MLDNKEVKIEIVDNGLVSLAKNLIRKGRISRNPIIRLSIKSLDIVRSIPYTIKRIITDKEFRAIFWMKTFKSKRVQQTTPLTCMNRYPVIFSACKDYLKDKENINILSYGCSTGEEVVTLREYFNNATIIGAEINSHSLEVCRSRNLDNKIKFIVSKESEISKYGKYDAVFCMAVLQRTPDAITSQGITSLKKIYPFEKFEKQIIELDRYVKKGGLLIIHFSQYYFEDTVVSKKYKALGNYNQDDYTSSIFDKNSNLIEEPYSRKSIFIKIMSMRIYFKRIHFSNIILI